MQSHEQALDRNGQKIRDFIIVCILITSIAHLPFEALCISDYHKKDTVQVRSR